MTNTETPSPHIVAVGASAGGLEAIETFFRNMPPDSGNVFVVIQHLSPDYKSLMVELLSKKTAMKVHRAEDGMEVLPDNVYLIPPGKNLTIFHGKLVLDDQGPVRGINLPIDIFLMSLAEDIGDRAVAIILSGTGSDGTRGVRAVKEAGGMVMVQDEESARFDGMPKAAAGTGLSDFILPPEKMPEQLVAYISHPYVRNTDRHDKEVVDDNDMTRLFAILRGRTKVDFTYYKPSTVLRRIERRMTVTNSGTPAEYTSYLEQNPGEITTLFRELLIGVTAFFRDNEAYRKLADEIIPEIVRHPDKKEIRFWSAGCSTGEEAYSLAILLREAMDAAGVVCEVKIFATDIDRDALQFAAAGVYPESIVADIPPEYLTRYFHRRDDAFCVSRQIREMIVFAQHNIFKDPPFTGIDLVSCRNLLIYLQPVLQRKVLSYFSFSLGEGGILFLGSSESTGDLAGNFEVIDMKAKLFRSLGKPVGMPEHMEIGATDTRSRLARDRYATFRRSMHQHQEDRVLPRFLEAVAGRLFPLAVIVNDQLEVLHILGNPEGFFHIPSGTMTNDITRMASREISIPITTGVQKVFRERKELRFTNIRFNRHGNLRSYNMSILPLPGKSGQEELVAIFIEENPEETTVAKQDRVTEFDYSRETEERIRDLERELQFSRENLQATIEELETSNEELQATNEELLASNEELQSTNEELQSTNEELYTVNAEYQNKIVELTELHHDIDNLLTETHVGTLFLDENLDIRRFSPQITTIFKLLDTDVGRPFSHIGHSLTDTDPHEAVRTVMTTSQTLSRETLADNGRWYLMRVFPYAVGPGVYSGVMLSFVDITETREAARALQKSEDRYRYLFRTMAQGVVYQDMDGKITAANPAAQEILGLTLDQMQGRTSVDPRWKAVREDGSHYPGEEHPSMVALRTGEPVRDVVMGVYNPGEERYRWIKVSAVPRFDEGGDRPSSVFATFDDMTDLHNAETAVRESEDQYRLLFEATSYGYALHEMVYDDAGEAIDYLFLKINPAFERLTGLRAEDLIGKRVREALPETEERWIREYARVVATGEPARFTEKHEGLGKRYSVQAFRTGEKRFAVLFEEVQE